MARVQIRRGVFETNSSSVHTLSIARELDCSIKLPDKIVFGKGPDVYSNYTVTHYKPGDKYYVPSEYSDPIQEKADELWLQVLGSYSLRDYFNIKLKIKSILESAGVKCEFIEDFDYLDKLNIYVDEGGDGISGCFLLMLEGDLHSGDEKYKVTSGSMLLNYLFSPKSFSTVYEDNYGYQGPNIPEDNITISKRC